MVEDETRPYDRVGSDSDMIMDAATFLDKVQCEVGAPDDCPFNSECIPLGIKMRRGICKCVPGTEENAQGTCVQIHRPFSKGPTIPLDGLTRGEDLLTNPKSDDLELETSSVRSIQNLTVSVLSKEV